jgi:O-antigen/teichoic acid export membrane protein
MDEFVVGFRRLMKVVLGVGVLGVSGAFVLGPLAVEILYDSELSRASLATLALGSVFYMVGLAMAQAVIALHGHALVALGWTTGMVTFVLSTWLTSGEVFRRVEIALLVGSGAAMVVFWLALRARLRAGAVPSQESVIEAMTDMPFEA